MSKEIHTNQKHMNHDDRVVIEKGLDNSEPMGTIAEKLGKDRFFEALGKKMTKQTATKLLRDGKVELKGCKSQKTGKTYDTTIVMTVDKNQRAVFQLRFEKGDSNNEKRKNKKLKSGMR